LYVVGNADMEVQTSNRRTGHSTFVDIPDFGRQKKNHQAADIDKSHDMAEISSDAAG